MKRLHVEWRGSDGELHNGSIVGLVTVMTSIDGLLQKVDTDDMTKAEVRQ